MDDSRCIPANPDIIGIGVRTAIYAQTILSFGPALSALADGMVTSKELDAVETQSMTILIIAFAILVSGIVQASTLGLSNFHVNIILYLSWMNNTSTFIYFLLYIRHRTQEGHAHLHGSKADGGRYREQMKLEWMAWCRHLTNALKRENPEGSNPDTARQPFFSTKGRSRFRKFLSKFVLVVGSLHLTMMSIMGLWLWSHPATFSNSKLCASQSTLIFGHVPVASQGQRIWSIIIYTAFLLPFVNLLIPIGGFLVILIHWPRLPTGNKSQDVEAAIGSKAGDLIIPDTAPHTQKPVSSLSRYVRHPLTPVCLGLAILFLVNIFFIADIETTIDRNASLRDPGDGEWSFGQTLALLLLLVPFRDLVETFVDRQEQRNKRQKEWEKQFRDAIKGLDVPRLRQLTRGDFHIDTFIFDFEDNKRTPLDVAISCVVDNFWLEDSEPSASDLEAIRFLFTKGANPNVQSGEYTYPLIHACTVDFVPLVRLLLRQGADPNLCIIDAAHNTAIEARGSPLHAAVSANSAENVQALIPAKADANITIRNGVYGTPLQMALCFGHFGLIEVLLQNGADPNLEGDVILYLYVHDPLTAMLVTVATVGTRGSAFQIANSIGLQIQSISQLFKKHAVPRPVPTMNRNPTISQATRRPSLNTSIQNKRIRTRKQSATSQRPRPPSPDVKNVLVPEQSD